MALLKKLLIFGVVLTLSGMAGSAGTGAEPTAAEDEILLVIHLDTDEDIFLMEADFSMDGQAVFTQGVCNANLRSPLTDGVYFQLLAEDFPASADLTNLTVSISVQIEPFAGNTMNTNQTSLIPAALDVPLPAALGDTIHLILSGNQTEGYQATLAQAGE